MHRRADQAAPYGPERRQIAKVHIVPTDQELPDAGFIDLHQDILHGVARLEGGFPVYGSNFLTGASHAAAVWSSLFPVEFDSSLLGQLEAHQEMLLAHESSLRLITTVEDMESADPRTGVLPHSEGFKLPAIDPDTLHDLWARRSLRSLSLTWNYETDYGFSCYDDASAPLKPLGRAFVEQLERSPIFLDLAHLNEAGFFETLDLYAPPILVTHSSCRAIVDHPRGLSDDQLRALGEHGGLVGLAFFPDFLGKLGSVDEALRHIDRIASLAGEDSVSIGSDWGVAEMGQLGEPASLVALVNSVSSQFGPKLARRFAYGNAYDFLCGQLPAA